MKKELLYVCLIFGMSFIQAQERNITGKVTDSSGVLPGVSILVKGTTNGTETNFDGKYSMKALIGDKLVFSYLGYKTMERIIGKSTIINVKLFSDESMLDEVVVMGYSSKRKRKSGSYRVTETVEGKVAGISVVHEKGKSSYEINEGKKPQSGQLTAGEINDISKWKEWLKLSKKNKEYQKIKRKWEIDIQNKLEVNVNNQRGFALNNAEVFLLNDNQEIISKVKTDVFGKAILFKNKREVANEYYIVQVLYNNKVKGERILANLASIDFVINQVNIESGIDVMFTIDATGSMTDEIDYLKSEIENIITRIDTSVQEKRIGMTFYRDIGDDYLTKDFDFTTDIAKIKTSLSKQNAGGGGDYEEAVEEALKISLSKSWNKNAKSRILFLLLDAPPHLNDKNIRIIKEQINIAKKEGIKIIPIVASGADKNVEYLMRYFSITTNGTYVFLTDDSGIGNKHLKPSSNKVKIEKLNDLIVRLIEKYAGV